MAFLDGLRFTGHDSRGWERGRSAEKAFYYNEQMGAVNPVDKKRP
jgi:hypothetical protein